MTGNMIKKLGKSLRPEVPPTTLFEKVWLIAPLAIWFSYYPLIRFGSNASMYFELSITTIYVAVLALAGLPIVLRHRHQLFRSKGAILITVFVAICGISLLWTADTTRGVLTFGILGALYVIFLATLGSANQIRKLTPTLVKILVLVTVLMSTLALVQIIASIWLDRGTTLLCAGCTPQQLGFARPNVFTIEPQFLGNILLIPSLVLFHLLLRQKRTIYVILSFLVVSTTLFLTLSRGAIFAFAVGLLLLLLIEFRYLKKFILPGFLLIVSFVVCLLVEGSAAAANPNLDITFAQAIRTSVNQLSLGVIDLPAPTVSTLPTTQPVVNNTPTTVNQETPKTETAPAFNGYVKQSTSVRLKLSSYALRSWRDNPTRILFGVGLGGSGVVLHNEFPDRINEREIVQNEFLEILLETGLVGIVLFVGIIALLFVNLRREKWLWAILVAFLVQWNFFSGYPNALHIYLVLILVSVAYKKHLNKLANPQT